MTRRVTLERRLYPRIEKKLPLNVIANGYDFTTTTKNVSCIGAYCRVEKYIPPFTKIAIRMSIPFNDGRAKSGACDVECKGVVVRTEDSENGGFNIAIFFNEINDNQRQVISRYVKQFLPQNPQP